ncbi:MAG: hypothetical protein ACK5HA_06980, partial [Planctomycetaceae bacterium]
NRWREYAGGLQNGSVRQGLGRIPAIGRPFSVVPGCSPGSPLGLANPTRRIGLSVPLRILRSRHSLSPASPAPAALSLEACSR